MSGGSDKAEERKVLREGERGRRKASLASRGGSTKKSSFELGKKLEGTLRAEANSGEEASQRGIEERLHLPQESVTKERR